MSKWLTNRRDAIKAALLHLAPDIPDFEREAVLDHALDAPGLRGATPENAAWLSLVAFIRHQMTDYDALLVEGYDRDSARFFVRDDIAEVLAQYGSRRTLPEEDEGQEDDAEDRLEERTGENGDA